MKTKTVELPVESKQHWQLTSDVLNMFVENEVMLLEGAGMDGRISRLSFIVCVRVFVYAKLMLDGNPSCDIAEAY